MDLFAICPCLDCLFKSAVEVTDKENSSQITVSSGTRRASRGDEPNSRSSRRSSKTRKRNDYIRFFKEPNLALDDLKFSHRLSTIANDKLINFIELPLTINDGGNGNKVKTITIKTPDQFFGWMGFERIKLLGKGGFGAVYLVTKLMQQENQADSGKERVVSRIKMACKEMRLKERDRNLINSLRAELYVLQSLSNKCRHVVNYLEHYVLGHYSVVEQCHSWLACIFIEFAEAGCLMDEVEKKGPLPLGLARRYFSEMVQGLAFMHKNLIAHNDFKLDNVLLAWDQSRRQKYCKLTDFGMARFAYKHGVGVLYSKRYCGTKRYMAPEVIRCGLEAQDQPPQYIPFSADIWSLGVSLYVMLRRQFPYDTPKDLAKLLRIMQRGVLSPQDLRQRFGSKLTQLLLGMLQFDADRRFSIVSVATHPWLKAKSV